MKEFSHPGSEGKCAIDLNHAIETTIAVARNEWKYVADVQTCFAADLPPVPCLAGEFNQVILNLLMNAAQTIGDVVKKGSAAKGTITSLRNARMIGRRFRSRTPGRVLPEDVRARIFEPFFYHQRSRQGNGTRLGLSPCRDCEKNMTARYGSRAK